MQKTTFYLTKSQREPHHLFAHLLDNIVVCPFLHLILLTQKHLIYHKQSSTSFAKKLHKRRIYSMHIWIY